MIEGPNIEKKDSAEQKFMFGGEDRFMQATKFASDPVAYLSQLNDELRIGSDDTTEIVLKVMDVIQAQHEVIYDYALPVYEKNLADYLAGSTYSTRALTGLFTLLREAGFTKSEVLTWILIESDDMTAEERLENRGMRTVLNDVYDEE